MKFWQKVIDFLKNLEMEDRNYFNEINENKHTEYKGQIEEIYWCPLCTYSGTADNVRCHIINDHKNK